MASWSHDGTENSSANRRGSMVQNNLLNSTKDLEFKEEFTSSHSCSSNVWANLPITSKPPHAALNFSLSVRFDLPFQIDVVSMWNLHSLLNICYICIATVCLIMAVNVLDNALYYHLRYGNLFSLLKHFPF